MDTMRTALAGEACLAPTKPCGGKAIDVILLPLQGAKMWVSVPPKALPWAEFCCPLRDEKTPEAKVEVKSSRHRRDCRGEACLARRVRSTRITDVAITHSKTSFVGYCGRGVPRPNRHNVPNLSCRYVYKLLNTNSVGAKPDSPVVCGAHELRLFSISILRARRASPNSA